MRTAPVLLISLFACQNAALIDDRSIERASNGEEQRQRVDVRMVANDEIRSQLLLDDGEVETLPRYSEDPTGDLIFTLQEYRGGISLELSTTEDADLCGVYGAWFDVEELATADVPCISVRHMVTWAGFSYWGADRMRPETQTSFILTTSDGTRWAIQETALDVESTGFRALDATVDLSMVRIDL